MKANTLLQSYFARYGEKAAGSASWRDAYGATVPEVLKKGDRETGKSKIVLRIQKKADESSKRWIHQPLFFILLRKIVH